MAPLDLSSREAAEVLGVSIGTLRRWSDLGYIEHHVTPGGHRRYTQKQLERFLFARRRMPSRNGSSR